MGIVLSQCNSCFELSGGQNQFQSNKNFIKKCINDTQIEEDFKHIHQLFINQYSNQNYYQRSIDMGTQKNQSSKKKIIFCKGKFLFMGQVQEDKYNFNANGLVIFQKNQNRYRGVFKNGLAQGEGTFMNKSRTIILKGVWRQGCPVQEQYFQLILGDQRYRIKFMLSKSQTNKDKIKLSQKRASGAKKIPIQQLQQQKSIVYSENDLQIKNKKQFFISGVQIQFPNQTIYRGQLKALDSTVQSQQGKLQEQIYKTVSINGLGQLVFPDKNYYKGEFSNGKMNGRGQFYYHQTGHKYVGEYRNGVKNGFGKYYFSETEYKEGIWIGGQLQQAII